MTCNPKLNIVKTVSFKGGMGSGLPYKEKHIRPAVNQVEATYVTIFPEKKTSQQITAMIVREVLERLSKITCVQDVCYKSPDNWFEQTWTCTYEASAQGKFVDKTANAFETWCALNNIDPFKFVAILGTFSGIALWLIS